VTFERGSLTPGHERATLTCVRLGLLAALWLFVISVGRGDPPDIY